jgi:hypothetical protein
VILQPDGTQSFMYNGEVSAPQGDAEDWVVFRPYGELVFLSLDCTGSDSMEVEILENNSPVKTYIKCGARMEELGVQPGASYALHLKADPFAVALAYTNYTLTVRTRP